MRRTELQKKKIIIFDLDGTLTKSKATMDRRMAELLSKLLQRKTVAVIGGGEYEQFKRQFVRKLKAPRERLDRLLLFPANATSFYTHRRGGWKSVYKKGLSPRAKRRIREAFKGALRDIRYVPDVPHKRGVQTYGPVMDDRGTEITFSLIGQRAPLRRKEEWDHYHDARPRLMRALRRRLPGFEIRSGGRTSIDVTPKGIDKAYGIRKIRRLLHVGLEEMLFVGDALAPGGNDYPAKRTGIDCIAVKGPEETKQLISRLVN